MKIKLSIDYHALWGQSVYVYGSSPELGAWNDKKALELKCIAANKWAADIDLKDASATIEYRYLIKENGNVVRQEYGEPHILVTDKNKTFQVEDIWIAQPQQNFLYTSVFTESMFSHPSVAHFSKYYKNTILLQVVCPYVAKHQKLVLCGSSKVLGEWNEKNALEFQLVGVAQWQLPINATQIKTIQQYKLAIVDTKTNKVSHWEEGPNRNLEPLKTKTGQDTVRIEALSYQYSWMNWKAAGVAIPVFSLRSEDSFGVGEFPDLKKMVDWAAATNQKVIQILPINDTTITYTWTDSYPYNAISIYALHPIYLGLSKFKLKDTKKQAEYETQAQALNKLAEVDYDKVVALKYKYAGDLFAEVGAEVLASADYKEFYKANEEWLFPYACFSCLRDQNNTADYRLWSSHSKFDKKALQKDFAADAAAKVFIDTSCFIQYLLHKQLVDVKEYAHQNSVVLKGDIPIGISRNSVEAWVEPHLFNLDTQTGAPPDDFSVNGQNWGFPTYNWDEMAKDGYQWWIKRFRKMSDYFDAYRIDHILGFFRIWEIPLTSVQGLLGYFSPALPMPVDEIRGWGMWFDEYRMTKPFIHENMLGDFFGEYAAEVKEKYLQPTSWQMYQLQEKCDTQVKIRDIFASKTDEKSIRLRDGLYALCNEVLFVQDKREPHKYHPRITAQFTFSFRYLSDADKAAFNRLYDDFFYHRHNQFWQGEAMKKLPTLISSTSMLVCGEDLGMIPDCVPSVMNDLQILSLEIERMPKSKVHTFEPLAQLPYMSVCTTSTHDMAPVRVWWSEDRGMTQRYYNEVLWKHGAAPEDCTTDICWQILANHLNSPTMLTILPLQDWLSVDAKVRRADANEERINIPAIAQHYWRYRMHITLEDLLKADSVNETIRELIQSSGRP